jgi:hypothetical protein
VTQPPDVRPPAAPPRAPAPPRRPPRPPVPVAAPSLPVRPAAVWARARTRLRAVATTEPGRLRLTGAALAVLLLLFGAVASWQAGARADAADDVLEHSQPLSADAASLYRSLADADSTAAGGFLAGGREPRAVRERYDRGIRTAAGLLSEAAASSAGSARAQREIATLNRELPRYTALVEAARANNRQGLPLGGAYLRHANERMYEHLLPAARRLYLAESAGQDRDHDAARSWPWPALLCGVAALAGLVAAQRRHYLRTNRVLSPGLAGATAATLVALLWLTGAHALARSALNESDARGARSLHALNDAWISSLRARGEEGMWLVARGAGSAYQESCAKRLAGLGGAERGKGAQRAAAPGLLGAALGLADDAEGRDPVRAAGRAVMTWQDRHASARAEEDAGDHTAAVAKVTGRSGSTGESFDRVNASLRKAVAHEQAEFESAAREGRGALTGLAAGTAALALAGAGSALLGVHRRLAEYR